MRGRVMAVSTKVKNQSWAYITRVFAYTIAFLGAAGSSLQHTMGMVSFINDVSKASEALATGLAVAFGGVMSGLVNLSVNFECLESFGLRLRGKKPKPKLETWNKKLLYWGGIAVFVVTGMLFGSTAVAFGSVGVLGAVAMGFGVFVGIIMVIQELETWLDRFDKERVSVKEWLKNLTLGQGFALVVSIFNVLALSLLFTLGLTTLLVSMHVPLVPALITSLVISFTGGAFTEFYFYNYFMDGFCKNLKTISENWRNFKKTKWPVVGMLCIVVNAGVNSALCYSGVLLLNTLFIAAGWAPIPLEVAVVVAIFGGMASFLLCSDFWIRNSKIIFTPWKYAAESPAAPSDKSEHEAALAPTITSNPLAFQPEVVPVAESATGVQTVYGGPGIFKRAAEAKNEEKVALVGGVEVGLAA